MKLPRLLAGVAFALAISCPVVARAAESEAPPSEAPSAAPLTVGIRPALIAPVGGQIAAGVAASDVLGVGGGPQVDFGYRVGRHVAMFAGTEISFLSRGERMRDFGGVTKSIVIEVGARGELPISRSVALAGSLGLAYRHLITDLAPQDELSRMLRLPVVRDDTRVHGIELRSSAGIDLWLTRDVAAELLAHFAVGDTFEIDGPRPGPSGRGIFPYAFAGLSMGARW